MTSFIRKVIMPKVALLVIGALVLNICRASTCYLRKYPDGYVCVCNETHCDDLKIDEPINFGDFILVTSAKSGEMFDVTKGSFNQPTVFRVKRQTDEDDDAAPINSITLSINRDKKYQSIVGFGGAFTGTVSHLLDLMPTKLRTNLYRDYYSQSNGIGYTMMRIPIAGCDFDSEPWAYNESPINDVTLSNFTQLDSRDIRKIEQINELKNVSQNLDIKVIGAAWSPPRWMKTNDMWSGRGFLKKEFYQTWADYHLQYLRLMRNHGLHHWAISSGNEPLNGRWWWWIVHFMSLGWKADDQGKWVGENLGPTLDNSEFADVRIFAGDDQRYSFPWWFDQMNIGSAKAMDFVSGLAVHWYWDQFVSSYLLDLVHSKYPNKIILNTESSIGDKPWETHGPTLGSWERGEKYALHIIQDLEHHVGGWIDWNLILDESGGPSYVNNTVDAAVILNSTTHREFYRQPIFYAMAHFSRFIPAESVRIESTLNGFRSGQIKVVAFLRPDGKIAIILYNRFDKTKTVSFTDDARGSFELELKPRSINSFLFA